MSASSAAAGFAVRPDDAVDVSQMRRVLVIMLRHHGDVLLTTPLYTALKAAAPQLEIDALVYRETLPMLACNPALAQVHSIDKNWKKQGLLTQISSEWTLLKTLQWRAYDLVIHLTDHRRGAWLTRWLKPRWSVAPKLRRPTGFWNGSFSHLYPSSLSVGSGSPLGRRHVVQQNLDALRRLGLMIQPAPGLTMVPGPQGDADAARFLQQQQADSAFILIQPTSRWLFKCWSVQNNAGLIRALLERGETVVLSCAPDARERAMVEAIVAQLESQGVPLDHLKLANDGGTLNRLAALIGRAKLFIGVDSVPMHIAAAMQTPTVVLFGPSGEFSWGPWQVVHRVITSDDHPCRPCGQDGCGGGKVSECLTSLPVARVLQAADELLLSDRPQPQRLHPAG